RMDSRDSSWMTTCRTWWATPPTAIAGVPMRSATCRGCCGQSRRWGHRRQAAGGREQAAEGHRQKGEWPPPSAQPPPPRPEARAPQRPACSGAQRQMIIEHSDLTTKVYQWLRDQILHHVFLPGDKLDVQQLADNLGVSRTPVKDAINRLTAEGLVVLQSRRGTY